MRENVRRGGEHHPRNPLGGAGGCSFSLNPPSQGATADGRTGQVTVTGAVGCTWTATSGNPDWISIVSGASGNGTGSFTYSVQPNSTNAGRSGTVTAGGVQFTVNQAASGSAGNCNFSVTPSTQSASAAGGSGVVTVSTSLGCSWTAASNAA